jgi:hypothetical protein
MCIRAAGSSLAGPKSQASCPHLTAASKGHRSWGKLTEAVGLYQPRLPWCDLDLVINSVLVTKVHIKMFLFLTLNRLSSFYLVIFFFYMLFLLSASLPSV